MKPPPFLPLSPSRQEEWGDSSSKKRRDLLSSPSVVGRTREREMEGGRCYSHPSFFYYSALQERPIYPSIRPPQGFFPFCSAKFRPFYLWKVLPVETRGFPISPETYKGFSLLNTNKNQHFLLSIFFLLHIKRWEGQWNSEPRKKPGGVEGGLFLFTCFLSK